MSAELEKYFRDERDLEFRASYFWQDAVPEPMSPVETWKVTDNYIMVVLGVSHRSRLGPKYNTPRTATYDEVLSSFCEALIDLKNEGDISDVDEIRWLAYWIKDTAMILFNDGGNYQCCLVKFKIGAEDNDMFVIPLGNFDSTLKWLKDFGIAHILYSRTTKKMIANVISGHLNLQPEPAPFVPPRGGS